MNDRGGGGCGAPDEVEPARPLPARGELLVLHAAAHEHNLLEAHDVDRVDVVSVRSNGRPSAQAQPPPTVAVLLYSLAAATSGGGVVGAAEDDAWALAVGRLRAVLDEDEAGVCERKPEAVLHLHAARDFHHQLEFLKK